ncbi:MAG: mechanosensitive ion channel family protein [Gammaproteobacteria bacterium]|jgi:MscS family membrane protein|nr:mechanosensitive ion channel family protein [Gammaproteobacteria bacterium]MBT3858764.1 mechanosensitive ion channel family protein [Gammaproteobacteria bacterium]MBT3986116.1 mechanosensitive ion channel family protein [Gammaproteobacteria bacterium]MBT4256349.1 mechanosensitive ion channel family protein [Gammaproteobacteria bacterium]MBT4581023.1 mechanosensitive ion channel family protein [Gammaproteobacteria bacterium]
MDFLSLESLSELGWGAELLAAVTLTLLARFLAVRLLKLLGEKLSHTKNVWDDAIFEAARGPLSWFILIMGLLWAVDISDGYLETGLFSVENLDIFRQITFIALISMFLVRFISLAEARILEDLTNEKDSDQTRVDPTTLHAIAKLLRLSVIISSVLVAMPTLGIEITALLAFGGVGGIAVGFAAQDLLANFFGGLMIYLDRPFDIGDWIRSPERNIEGTVESIGWRLTVVRTFDKRPLYVPNSVFTTLALENPSRMSHRRIKETIGIRYQDSAKMGAIVEAVKAMLQNHEDIDASQTLIVNFDSYAPSSLDFFIYTFTKTTNWIRFHEVKQDVMLKIIDIVLTHDADFAFPTTTVDGIDGLIASARGEH